jgi:hypothetical protein
MDNVICTLQDTVFGQGACFALQVSRWGFCWIVLVPQLTPFGNCSKTVSVLTIEGEYEQKKLSALGGQASLIVTSPTPPPSVDNMSGLQDVHVMKRPEPQPSG